MQNLHNAVSKTNAIKALESLVAHDRIICKMFGKAPIYVCKEQQLSLPEDLDIKDITMENVEELREELNLLKNELNEWQTKLNQLNKDPTNVELIQTLLQKENEVLQIKDKLEKTNSDWNPENGIVIEQIIKQEKQIDKTIKERKKIMQDAVALVFMAQNLSNAKAKSEYLVCDSNFLKR